jgi:predicted nuclease of predicted toxin-antitoxin system
MKLKLDENIPIELLDDLLSLGHEADSVKSEGLAGEPDQVILERARAEARVLLTLDKGIGNVRAFPPNEFSGIVLLRPPSSGRDGTLSFARKHLPAILAEDMIGRLLVVTDQGLRRR